MVDQAKIDTWLKAIKSLPELLQSSIAKLDKSQLSTPYREGGWTVKQVVHHLADSHLNGVVRLKLTLTEDNPTLKPFDQDLWAIQADNTELDIENSLLLLQTIHKKLVVLIENLAEADWSRKAYHPEFGSVTPAELIELYAKHGEKHLEHINSLKRAHGWK